MNRLGVHAVPYVKASAELPVQAFGKVPGFALLAFTLSAFTLDQQDTVFQGDFDAVFAHPGQISDDAIIVFVLDDVHMWPPCLFRCFLVSAHLVDEVHPAGHFRVRSVGKAMLLVHGKFLSSYSFV
ncbi:hypothetical protein BMS3Bbin04_00889 [bacterium BMS3Bbin04]|nr:hypothetical protein BMS3Bbin04_00889 [bacterium BMS3Bbin04]